jgi:hypothetical protein
VAIEESKRGPWNTKSSVPGMFLSPLSRTYLIRLSSITVVNRPKKNLNIRVRGLAKTKSLSH